MESADIASMLTSSTCHSLVRKDGSQLKIADALENKVVGLLFAANRSKACHDFVKKLKPIYDEINKDGRKFEIVYLSNDQNQKEFTEMLESLPLSWLALPFHARQTENKVAKDLNTQVIPSLVLIDRDGNVLSTHGRSIIIRYGASAFPFTEEHLNGLQKQQEEVATTLPQKTSSTNHTAHDLHLVYDPYKYHGMFLCHKCNKEGNGWCYFCTICSYAEHPECIDPSYDLGLSRNMQEGKKLAFEGILSAITVSIIGFCTYCCSRKNDSL